MSVADRKWGRMLRNGADVTRKVHGNTALWAAIREHSTELVELLIQEGAADVQHGREQHTGGE